MSDDKPRMYHEFAEWFHLLTAPDDYAEEADFYYKAAVEALGRKPDSLLELGSGGGNNASHYKAWVKDVVLSDRSAEMLALSKTLNPELEHVQGDMTSVRLGRTFDVVFAHDACSYLTTPGQLRGLAETAAAHLKPGGVAVFCPDNTAENLSFDTDHGGHDGDGRAMRYLEWSYPGPEPHTYFVDYVYVYHEDGKPTRTELDRHINGALPRQTWLEAMTAAGFEAQAKPFTHSEVEQEMEIFVGRKS